MRFSYKQWNFSRGYLLVKMVSKAVTSTDKVYWTHDIDEYPPLFSRSLNENAEF